MLEKQHSVLKLWHNPVGSVRVTLASISRQVYQSFRLNTVIKWKGWPKMEEFCRYKFHFTRANHITWLSTLEFTEWNLNYWSLIKERLYSREYSSWTALGQMLQTGVSCDLEYRPGSFWPNFNVPHNMSYWIIYSLILAYRSERRYAKNECVGSFLEE